MKKNNKISLLAMLLAAAGFLLQSCGKDNKVSYPTSTVSGRIVYKGQPVGLNYTSADINATNNLNNPLFLTQTGPGKFAGGDIKVYAKHDGSFTINTFDGEYILKGFAVGKNPFLPFDPIPFTLKGSYTTNIEVTPYFWVSNYKTTFANDVFTATFKLEKIVPTAALAGVRVYFGTTNLVDINNIAVQRGPFTTAAQGINVDGNCTITVDLSAFTATEKAALAASTNSTFVTIAVFTTGVSDALYTDVVKLK